MSFSPCFRSPLVALVRARCIHPARLPLLVPGTSTPSAPHRYYASKSKKDKDNDSKSKDKSKEKGTLSSADLVPGSQKAVSDAAAPEYAHAEERMRTAVDWFRKECAALESRASGRVTPALLAPVRVTLKGHGPGEGVRVEEVATVGVKDGSMLVVTIFDDANMKAVEDAIFTAKLPHIVPQRQDARTLRIPIPKPTVDARTALYTGAHKQAEDTRAQLRKFHTASVKKVQPDKVKAAKRSPDLEAFQKLTDKYIADVDKILADLKKSTAPR